MRRLGLALMAAGMLVFGMSVYLGLASLRTVRAVATPPVTAHTMMRLPGSIYLVQQGGIYRLRAGEFSLLAPAAGHWSQPALLPDGSGLVASSTPGPYSDLYLLDMQGRTVRRLTDDRSADLPSNHWAYYPAISPDSKSVYYSTDDPKNGYQVDFAIWSRPLSQGLAPVQVTDPNQYTGGDVEPNLLPGGALLFVRHSIDDQGVYSEVWLQRGRFTAGVPLTTRQQDCREPALSPAGDRVALVCTSGRQQSHLVIAAFDGTRLGPLHEVVTDSLAAAPVWAPDGSGLAFLAPGPAGSRFQLWWLEAAALQVVQDQPPSPGPSSDPSSPAASISITAVRPVAVTTGLDLDPLSPPRWAP